MLCFVCSEESEETLTIFGEEGLEYHISEIIEKHLDLKLQEDETCEICGQCWLKLSDFNEYYQYVAKVHSTSLNTLKEIIETEVEYKYDEESSDYIKKECLAESPKSNSEIFETEDIFTENPFLEFSEEEDNFERTDNIKNKVTRELLKCGKAKKPSKIKKEEDIFTENPFLEFSSEEENLERKVKSKKIKRDLLKCDKAKKNPKIKNEENDKSTDDNKSNITSRPNSSGNTSTQKTAAETRRRKGHLLLEENEDLIKKHIKMLCQICTYSCDEFQNLIKHFKEYHPDVKPHLKCCERKLDCPSDILQHAYYHEDPDYFKCSDCDKRFINNSGLRDHYLQNHEPESNLTYGCDQCPRRFARKNLLEHHKSKHIPKTERSHFCEICKPTRAFANEYILQIHIKSRHTKATNICHVCAKEIRDKQAFEKHVRLHFESSGPRIKCPREGCDSWLKDKDNLKQHLRRFHDARQYECPQCGRVCKNKHSLTCHLKSTHTTKLYVCEDCQKSFKSQQSLKEHKAAHTGEPLYNCPFCTRTFNSKANMYSHKKKAHPQEWESWHQSRKGST